MQNAHLRGSCGWVRKGLCLMGRQNQSVGPHLRGRVCVWVGVGVGHAHLPSPAWLMAQVDLGVRKHDPVHAICIATHQG